MRMKYDKETKQTLFVGRVLHCPMCGQWMLRRAGFFGKLMLVAGEVECGRCGAVVSFGGKTEQEGKADE